MKSFFTIQARIEMGNVLANTPTVLCKIRSATATGTNAIQREYSS
jgi:hypothetical protein